MLNKSDAKQSDNKAMAAAAVEEIRKLEDAAGRLGYEIKEVDFFEGSMADSYDTVGRDLLNVIARNEDNIELIEEVVIAITGYGFESLLGRMKEHKDYWDAL